MLDIVSIILSYARDQKKSHTRLRIKSIHMVHESRTPNSRIIRNCLTQDLRLYADKYYRADEYRYRRSRYKVNTRISR